MTSQEYSELMHRMDNLVTQREYVDRTVNLEQRVAKLEASSETLQRDFMARFDKMDALIHEIKDDLNNQLNAYKNDVYTRHTDAMRWTVGMIISFVLGGSGVVGLIELFHSLPVH